MKVNISNERFIGVIFPANEMLSVQKDNNEDTFKVKKIVGFHLNDNTCTDIVIDTDAFVY